MVVSVQDQILRLAIAALLAGLIGWERESGRRPAGLRTHMLVAVGSALLMIVSQDVFLAYRGATNADPARIAAQVVSGIGFLGAGTILREGPTIRGLTTAASLWVAAALGLAVGAGAYIGAVSTTLITLATLIYLARLERRLQKKGRVRVLRVLVADRPGQLGAIGSVLGQHRVDIRNIELQPVKDDRVQLEMIVAYPSQLNLATLLEDLRAIDGVNDITTDDPS
ncbi:MAG TPA: MgtC/SapB family protein [Bacillota bacterium]